MSSPFFTRQDIVALLEDLGADLHARGIRGELFLVGGAAMALAFSTRRTTRDIDGVFEPKAEVYEAAGRLAARRGLTAGWLNDAVKGLLPGPDPDAREALSVPGLRVSVPSARYLLALKVAAAEEVLVITEQVMGGRQPLLPKAQFLIQAMFSSDPLPEP